MLKSLIQYKEMSLTEMALLQQVLDHGHSVQFLQKHQNILPCLIQKFREFSLQKKLVMLQLHVILRMKFWI